MFVQELLLSTLTEQLHLPENLDDLGGECEEENVKLITKMSPTSEANQPPSIQHNTNNQSKEVGGGSGGGGTIKSTSPEKLSQPNTQKQQHNGGGFGSGSAPVTRQNQGHSYQGTQVWQGHGTVSSSGQVFNLPGSNPLQALAGAGMAAGNMHPLPGRPGSGSRDNRVNPAAVKKSMFKQLPTSQASDREPPPH